MRDALGEINKQNQTSQDIVEDITMENMQNETTEKNE